MHKENQELVTAVLTAVYAKEKLNEVQKFIDSCNSDVVSKSKLQEILSRQAEDFME